MSLLVKASREGRTIVRVTPETAMWKHVGFAAYRLGSGEAVQVHEERREVCIVVLSGTATIEAGEHKWEKLGSRDRVFEDAAPYAVYLPPGLAATIRSDRDAEIGVASAPATGKYPARLIEPSRMSRTTRGKGANTRYVCWWSRSERPAATLPAIRRISMTRTTYRWRVRSRRLTIIG